MQQQVAHNHPGLEKKTKIISRYKVPTAIIHLKTCERDLPKLLYKVVFFSSGLLDCDQIRNPWDNDGGMNYLLSKHQGILCHN